MRMSSQDLWNALLVKFCTRYVLAIHTGYISSTFCCAPYRTPGGFPWLLACLPAYVLKKLAPSSLFQIATSFYVVPEQPPLGLQEICRPVLHPGRARRAGLHHCLISTSSPRSQNTTLSLPLLQVLLAVNRSARLIVLPVLGDLLNALRDKRRQLCGKKSVSASSSPQLLLEEISLTLKPVKSGHTYVRTFL